MYPIDVIILSFAKNKELQDTTLTCIESLMQSENPSNIQFNIVVFESNKNLNPFCYPHTKTIYPAEKFGYNRYLNLGTSLTHHRYICYCNNDLHFHKNWASRMIEVLEQNDSILSASPKEPWLHSKYDLDYSEKYHLGYEKMKFFTGWCFMVKREIFETIGNFDEKFLFWYVDDDYIQTLQKYHLKHALVTSSEVDHLSGRTIQNESLPKKTRDAFTTKQWVYFDYKWNHHSKILYYIKLLRYTLMQWMKL